MLPTFTSMVDGMLEESLKQSLAMSNILFSGRRQPTHCRHSVMYLRFHIPAIRQATLSTHSVQSKICNLNQENVKLNVRGSWKFKMRNGLNLTLIRLN
jgi:tRNA A37 threonylcarbamoyladenosine synthetase subunit TsaC/SUA5/YrdC